MLPTFCNSGSAALGRLRAAAARGDRSGLPARPAQPVSLAAETRAYFRCFPLEATISVQQCRANRERLSPHEALALPFDLPPWWVQPLPCWSCTLAVQVEASRVPFYSAEEVLSGVARQASESLPAARRAGGSHDAARRPSAAHSAAPPLLH